MNIHSVGEGPMNIALVGLGKISLDQHIPAIRANPALALVAGCSPHSVVDGLPCYHSLDAMLAQHPEIDALAICTPPQVRYELARRAMQAGKHVLLEKPPAATAGEAEAIRALAMQHSVSVLAGWHSRYAPAIDQARAWVATHAVSAVRVAWKENVRKWHPGQRWIFEAGGMGVFDSGINALSILTALFPGQLQVKTAQLHVPSNCNGPVRAELSMLAGPEVPVEAEFDFLQTGEETWSIFLDAAGGDTMALHMGGEAMEVNGSVTVRAAEREYPNMYAHFAQLVAAGGSELDNSPLLAVADAFMIGQRNTVAPYIE
jgi:predicted dehydrogenase